MKDGLVLFYVKDGIILPVALTQEQGDVFDMLMNIMPGTVRVINKPQGTAINLMAEKRKSTAMEIDVSKVEPLIKPWTIDEILRREG